MAHVKLTMSNLKDYLSDLDSYHCVLFSKKNCSECKIVLSAFQVLSQEFPDVKFYDFFKHQKMAEKLVERLRVVYLPRIIIFKENQVVGRILMANYPIPLYESVLRDSLCELIDNDRILPTEYDVESVTQFNELVQQVLIAHHGFTLKGKNVVDEANKAIFIADFIIQDNIDWGTLTGATLKNKCAVILDDIKSGQLKVPEVNVVTQGDGSKIVTKK